MFSSTSTRAICTSWSRSVCSNTFMLSLRSVISPPCVPHPPVKMWFPFHLNLNVSCSIWVSCIATIRLEEGLCDLHILFINWVNLLLFFRPRLLRVIIVMSIGPGFDSMSPINPSRWWLKIFFILITIVVMSTGPGFNSISPLKTNRRRLNISFNSLIIIRGPLRTLSFILNHFKWSELLQQIYFSVKKKCEFLELNL